LICMALYVMAFTSVPDACRSRSKCSPFLHKAGHQQRKGGTNGRCIEYQVGAREVQVAAALHTTCSQQSAGRRAVWDVHVRVCV
jgi:hypothetical protein